MKGMNKEEQKVYIMEYTGWTDDEPAECDLFEDSESEPEHLFGS